MQDSNLAGGERMWAMVKGKPEDVVILGRALKVPIFAF